MRDRSAWRRVPRNVVVVFGYPLSRRHGTFSEVMGLAFAKSGLTRRVAYKMLELVGERTSLILLGSLVVTAGMPFALPIGAAPNAITHESKQFTTAEFFTHGIVMSIVPMLVLGIVLVTVWPMLGMPIVVK